MLFSDRSIWTMVHGIVLSGGALLALAVLLYGLLVLPMTSGATAAAARLTRPLALVAVTAAALLWLTVLAGTYIVFPPYRAVPPEGLASLADYPRALLLGSPQTAWLHSFAMEIKEHVPWIIAMIATATAYVVTRYRGLLQRDRQLRIATSLLTALCFALVSAVALLGVFVNKVAPLH